MPSCCGSQAGTSVTVTVTTSRRQGAGTSGCVGRGPRETVGGVGAALTCLSPSSSVSSRTAPTSSSSSAACLARCSRPSHRLPPSCPGASCQTQVRRAPLWLCSGRAGLRLCPAWSPLPAELGYADQLLQCLQATAQENGFFGESLVAGATHSPGGRGLLPPAGHDSPAPRRRAAE